MEHLLKTINLSHSRCFRTVFFKKRYSHTRPDELKLKQYLIVLPAIITCAMAI